MTGLNILLFGDMNVYTFSLYGFSGESEFDSALPEDIRWPVRKKKRVVSILEKIKTEKN